MDHRNSLPTKNPSLVVVLGLSSHLLQRFNTVNASSNEKKKRRIKSGKDGLPHRDKLGRPRSQSLIKRRKAVEQLEKENDEEALRRHQAAITKINKQREETLVETHKIDWADMRSAPDDPTEAVRVQLSNHPFPTPLIVSRFPAYLPTEAQADIVRGEYLMQELGKKLDIPVAHHHISVHRRQRGTNTACFQPVQPLVPFDGLYTPPPASSIPSSPMTQKQYYAQRIAHQRQMHDDLDAGHPIFDMPPPPPPQNHSLYTVPPVQPPRPQPQPVMIGRYSTEDPAYHYNTTMRDEALFLNPLRQQKVDPQTQMDHQMMLLNNMRQYYAAHVDPLSLAMADSPQASRPAINRNGMPIHNQTNAILRRNSAARTLASLSRARPRQDFLQTQLMEEIRDFARTMNYKRHSWLEFCKAVAGACTFEECWRRQSRGEFVEDNAANGSFQDEMEWDGTDRGLKLGYRREGVYSEEMGRFEIEEEKAEEARWKAAEEWRHAFRVDGMNELQVNHAMNEYASWEENLQTTLNGGPEETVVEEVVRGPMGEVRGLLLQEPQWK